MAAQPGANAGRNKRRRERQAAEELGPAAADALVHARSGDLAALRAVWSADITSTAATVCLCWAAGGGHLGCVRYLAEERGADAAAHEPRRQRTALHFAARDGRVEVARYLLERCAVPVDAPSVHEITALQLAAWRSQLGTAQLLSAAGARVDCVNSFGCGAGHWAALCEPSLQPAAEEHEALLLLLQEGGADLRAPNSQGHTPLHKAAFAGNLVCCRWLARTLGVLDEREDEAGNYAADMAELGGHAELAAWLRAHCSRASADAYCGLGLRRGCGEAAARKAYHALARTQHPDRARSVEPAGEKEERRERGEGAADAAFSALHAMYARVAAIERQEEPPAPPGGADGLQGQRNAQHAALRRPRLTNGGGGGAGAAEEAGHGGGHGGGGGAEPGAEAGAGAGSDDEMGEFKARLLVLAREFPAGLPVSDLRKQYARVFPTAPFPEYKKRFGKKLVFMLRSPLFADAIEVQMDNPSHAVIVALS